MEQGSCGSTRHPRGWLCTTASRGLLSSCAMWSRGNCDFTRRLCGWSCTTASRGLLSSCAMWSRRSCGSARCLCGWCVLKSVVLFAVRNSTSSSAWQPNLTATAQLESEISSYGSPVLTCRMLAWALKGHTCTHIGPAYYKERPSSSVNCI